MSLTRSLLMAMGLCAAPARAAAQQPPDAWRFQVELGFNGASGNSSFSILRTGAKVNYLRTDRAEVEISGLLRYGRSDGRTIANDARTTVKLDLNPQEDFSPFLFVTSSRDPIRKLDFKSNGGLGAKVTFWRGETGKASFSLAGIFDYEDFRLDPETDGRESQGFARWSGRFKLDRAFGSSAAFQHVTFYQPVWDGFGDYVLDVSNTVSTKILANLTMAVEQEYIHDSVPPPDVKPGDHRFSVVLRATF